MPLKEFHASEQMKIGTKHQLMVTYWHKATVPDVKASTACCERLSKNGRFGLLTITSATYSPRIEPGIREASAEMINTYDKHLIGHAMVVLAPGLAGTAVRSFMTGFTLFAKFASPMKVFASVEGGIHWHQSLHDQDPAMVSDVNLLADVTAFMATLKP